MPPVFSKETQRLYVVNESPAGQHRTSPCEVHCLAGNPIQKLLNAVADNAPEKALYALRAVNPFPGISGRVCPHPCSGSCNRGQHDEALSIRSLERFAADHGAGKVKRLRPLPPTGRKIAVIGSGPAGLSCAYFSALLGHEVCVFEASAVAGGVPRQSIPDFRLPKDIVDREVGMILDLGVVIHTNTEVGRDVALSDIMQRFDACVIAVGNRRERRLNIPGIEQSLPAVEFLRRSNLDRKRLDGRNVVILGGGGVAFDCAFTARRLGAAAVSLVCLEDREHLKVPREEVAQADDEGIRLHTGYLAAGIATEGALPRSVLADPVTAFSFDESGRLQVEKADAPQLHVDADMVICASGLLPDLDFLEKTPVEKTPRGCLRAHHGATSIPGLFAVGECASGPSLVSAVVRDGRRTAFAINAWLQGENPSLSVDAFIDEDGTLRVHYGVVTTPRHETLYEEIVNTVHHIPAPRHHSVQLTARETWLAFEELDKGLLPEDAVAEAKRCMHCGHCQKCGECVDSCPGLILEMGEASPRVAYPDECWHCGCCRLACPGSCISFNFPIHTFL